MFPVNRYVLVFLTILGVALLLIFAGGKSSSVIGIECGSWQYFLVTFLVLVLIH